MARALAAWLLALAAAVQHPSTAGVDLYAAIGGSPEMDDAALAALCADRTVSELGPDVEAAEALLAEAKAARERHESALAAAGEAGNAARRARFLVNDELDKAQRALKEASRALNGTAEGGPFAETLRTFRGAYERADALVEEAVAGLPKLKLGKGKVKEDLATIEANVTAALLEVSLSQGANATLRRAYDAFRWDKRPGDPADRTRVLDANDLLDSCDPAISREAIAALPPIDWSQPLDPLRVRRDAALKKLTTYFGYATPFITFEQFKVAVLRTVAHEAAATVDAFAESIAFDEDGARNVTNVSAASATFLLDRIFETAAVAKDPERYTDRRALLDDGEAGEGALSLAESIRNSCVKLDSVPPLLARAEDLERAATDLRVAAEQSLADADAVGLVADAAYERAKGPWEDLERRSRIFSAACETFGDPEKRARYDTPCVASRDAPAGCCARALPSGAVELECASTLET